MNLAYRDEVPPVPTKNPQVAGLPLSPRVLLVGLGALVLIVLSFIVISITTADNHTPKLQRLSLRLVALQATLKEADKEVSDPKLDKLSSDLSILTTGSIARLQAPLQSAGMGEPSDQMKAAEADLDTLKKLEEAQLTGVFDRTYLRILQNKLDLLLILMKDINQETKKQALKTELAAAYRDFATIRKQLNDVSL